MNWIQLFLIGLPMLLFSVQERDGISYFQTSTLSIKDSTEITSVSTFDSLSAQEIFQVRASDGTPLHYYIELNTGVCFDNECRPLSISVYWNITGRYLGFELLDEEFLSKYDHEPFTPSEYERLHQLLADPFLPLGDYTFDELVHIPDTTVSIDGVSGATSQDVLEHVVEGAAYTTYKLWNVVYGPIQQQVIAITEKQLDASLFTKILRSPDPADQTWALERILLLSAFEDPVIEAIMEIIVDGPYFQSYLALKSINPERLSSESLQVKLYNAIGNADYGIENLIFDKLMSAPYLSQTIIDQSISELQTLSSPRIVNLLKLYKKHEVCDPDLTSELLVLAKSDNAFIKSQVSRFLEDSPCD